MKHNINHAVGNYLFKRRVLTIAFFLAMSFSLQATDLNLKLFIQGYYIGNSQMRPGRMLQGCTTYNSSTTTMMVTVNLLDVTFPNALSYTTQAILNTDGTCIATFPATIIGNSYILNIRGCNFFNTCAAAPITINSITSFIYDFTNGPALAYGANTQVEVEPGIWALISGDPNQDGVNTAADLALIWGGLFNSGCGLCADVDGDGNVGISDLILQWSNNSNMLGQGCIN